MPGVYTVTLTITDTETSESNSLLRPAYIQVDTGTIVTQTITVIHYGYDALYRLTGATYTGDITATFAYVYDPVGNMTAFTETVGTETTRVTRTFDVANRLQTALDLDAGTTSYIYDANGNMAEVYPPGRDAQNPVGVLRYGYDQRNLMASHETNVDGTAWVLQAEYVYDGANDRLQQMDYTGASPVTTTYTNDVFGLTQVLVADDGTTHVYNLFGLDLISQESGSEVRTLLADGLGSVRTEIVGNVVEAATTYEPYGQVLAQSGTSGTVYGFTGEQEDAATGLLYLRARYYSSQLKTFMSRDPWEGTGWRPGTLNYYAYVYANPVNYVDPTGWARIKIWASAFLEPTAVNFPSAWLTAPFLFTEAVWEGDGRTYYAGGNRPSARVWHEVVIETGQIDYQCNPYELNPDYIVSNLADTGSTRVDIYIAASTIPVSLVGKAPAPAKAVVRAYPSERAFVVTLEAHSPNPVTEMLGITGTPPIDYWYAMRIDLRTGRLNVAGYHDEYPWHELYFEIDNTPLPMPLVRSAPSGPTKSPLDLGKPFFGDRIHVNEYRFVPALRG